MSKYVMAHVEMPIEVKPDGTINPLQGMVKMRITHTIQSIESIDMTDMPPSIQQQIDELLKKEKESSDNNNIINQNNNIKGGNAEMVILKEECKKTLQKKTNNCSFKNYKKHNYNHNKTAKNYKLN